MENLTHDQLRKILAAEGYTQEQIDAACKVAYGAIIGGMEAIVEMLRTVTAAWDEFVAQLGEIYTAPLPQNLPRPPRYAGPKNKGNPYTQQPARTARSCCRKMRR